MVLHANAALSHRQRERLVALVFAGATITAAALVVGCSRQTASKWVARARRGEGLHDRSSRPRRSPRRTPQLVEQAVLRARRELGLGPHPLGWALGLAASTVHAILRRHGCSRLEPRPLREEVVRYERARPGELVHIDVKSLGRIARRRDPASGRLVGKKGAPGASSASSPSTTAAGSPTPACTRRRRPPPRPPSSPTAGASTGATGSSSTDNGPCFKRAWERACAELGIRARRTRPHRPQTNGKVERLIRTLGEGWAYSGSYASERERTAALAPFLDYYNRRRPHRALGGQTPLQRVNNVLGTNTPGSLVGSLLPGGVVVRRLAEPAARSSLPSSSSRL